MADEPDYYALLQIADSADLAAIRLAFRRLARRYHPDVAGTGSLAQMQQLNAAYHTLTDPELRQAYDARRAPSVSAPGARPAPSAEEAVTHAGTLSHSSGPLLKLRSLPPTDTIPAAALSFTPGGAFVGVGLLDGSVEVWDTRLPRLLNAFSFNTADGILQDLRLSPSGTLVIAWGFQLGIRVWSVTTGQSLWHIGAYGPSGAMDAALFDTPSWVRLALPDAPLTLSEEDPFRWAVEGRLGSEILNRPLEGPVDPAWAVPAHCPEVRPSKRGYGAAGMQWRVQQRILSGDGRLLLTISTGRVERLPHARIFRLWELDHRSARGGSAPYCFKQIEQPAEYLQFPLAVTPDLSLACSRFQERELRLFSLGAAPPRRQTIAIRPSSAIGEDAEMDFSPDGRYLAVASGPRLDLFDAELGRHLQQWQMATPITALAFAPYRSHPLLGIALQNGLTELWGDNPTPDR
ncbi:MAG: DnaJ domain-containing protein [Ktedonobacterales bacterium]